MIRRFAARVARIIRSNDGVAIPLPPSPKMFSGIMGLAAVGGFNSQTPATEDACVVSAGIALAKSRGTLSSGKVGTLPRERLISLVQWGVILGVMLLDLCLARVTGIGPSHLSDKMKFLIIVLAVWPAITIVTRLTGFAVGAEVIAENIAKFCWFSLVGCVLTYFVAMSERPLQDTLVVKIDSYLGFSWQEFFLFISNHKVIATILSFLYATLLPKSLFVLAVVGSIYPQRGSQFVTAFIISTFLALTIFLLFPVAGAFVYFHHLDLPAAKYCEHYLGMRSHSMTAIPMDDLRGVVQFPSFHVSSAVVLTYLLRGLPIISPLAIVINVGMSVSALYVGGHHLSDALAGAVIGVITIAIVHWLEGPGPEPQLPWRRPAAPEKTGEMSLASSAPIAAE